MRRPALTPLACAVALAFALPVQANPTGAQVAAGAAGFHAAGKTLTVTNTPGAIINWQSFSIGAGATTHFQQQSSLSAVLNRVIGSDPSQILGTLSSNGRVFLVNPHGIVFGQGAVINTAGFVASTLNMRDEDFLAGRMKFEGGGLGALKNEGAIHASGDIFLVGPQIENAGLIKSDNGSVLLAAGQSLTISSPDAHGVQFALQAPTDTALNIGAIEAKNAAGMFAGTLRHSGDIRVTSASVDASGRVILAAQKDAILDGNATINVDNSAGRGGVVQITGERVGLFDSAGVTARGAAGGGEILVGGDYKGGNPEVRNAEMTYVSPMATLDASATAAGDGGRIIVWADDSTRVHGNVFARGGLQGGAGGFIETSGRRFLDVAGINLSASGDVAGMWLLDPYNVTVVAGAGTASNSGAPGFVASGDDSQIGADLIVAQLNSGTGVTISTFGAGTQAGNIIIDAPIVKTANNAAGMILNADGDITVNQNIDLGPSTTASFNALAGGAFAINNATVSAMNIHVTADSIQRSGTQTNDFSFSQNVGGGNGMFRLTATAAGVGGAAEPIRFNDNFGYHDVVVTTSVAGAAGDVYLSYTGTGANYFGLFPGTVVTDAASSQTVSLTNSRPTNGEITLVGSTTGNDHWIINTSGGFGVSYGSVLTANSITATIGGGIGYINTFPNTTIPLAFDTSAANGNISVTALNFPGNLSGGAEHGLGVRPGTGTVTAVVTQAGGSNTILALKHFGGDLLTSRYNLSHTGGGTNSSVYLQTNDGHIIVDDASAFNVNTSNQNWRVRTYGTAKDIRFSGGTLTGNVMHLYATGNIDNLAASTTSWREVCVSSCSWIMEAGGGIGLTNPVRAEADWVGNLQTSGVGADGNIRVIWAGSPRISGWATDTGSAQTHTLTGANLLFSQGSSFPGLGYVLSNDAINIDITGNLQWVNNGTTHSAASLTINAGGSITRESGASNNYLFRTSGAMSITAGGTVGEAGNYVLIPSAGSLMIHAGSNIYLDAGANPLSLAGLSTGAGAGTIGLRTTAANDLTLGGATNINDALVLNIGGNIIFPAASGFTTSGGLTLNSPTQIAATATVNVTGGTLAATQPVSNAGTLTSAGTGGDFSGGFTNSGTVNVNAGTLGLSGGYTDGGGLLMLGGGAVTAPAAGLTLTTGTLGGVGTVTGNVINGGSLSVGASPGTLVINGNFTQGAGSALNVELGGLTQGVDYDLLQVTGAASLDGTLNVALFGGFTGSAGNVFDVLTYGSRTGDFATVNFPAGYTMTATPNAAFYQLAINSIAVPPLVLPPTGGGDFDTQIVMPASEVKILNDKFLAIVEAGKQPEEEEKKGAVLECK